MVIAFRFVGRTIQLELARSHLDALMMGQPASPAVLKSVRASRVKERACQTCYMLVCIEHTWLRHETHADRMISCRFVGRTHTVTPWCSHESWWAHRVIERACQTCYMWVCIEHTRLVHESHDDSMPMWRSNSHVHTVMLSWWTSRVTLN